MNGVLFVPAQAQLKGLKRFALLVLGMLLVLDAVWLMGKGLFNLGVVLPFAIGAAFLLIAWRWWPLMRDMQESASLRRAWRWGWAGFSVWLLSVAAFSAVLLYSGRDAANSGGAAPSALIVLGSGTPGGKPSPALQARLDTALVQAARYPHAKVVVSGGIDFSETIAEAQVMGDYLRARGLSAERIVQEEKSTSTHENLRFSAALLRALGVNLDVPVRVITSDFHTLRARWIARRVFHLDIGTAGAPTPLYVRYNAWLREYFAFISGWVLGEY